MFCYCDNKIFKIVWNVKKLALGSLIAHIVIEISAFCDRDKKQKRNGLSNVNLEQPKSEV